MTGRGAFCLQISANDYSPGQEKNIGASTAPPGLHGLRDRAQGIHREATSKG